ncbi:hypothetical protein PQR53_15435 [Paraburkholderia fungorum]|uniref:hypothetical protein n=1 Tax=Paraburkholderia fungorum TaxID=134537 RepID=UPI0038BC6496
MLEQQRADLVRALAAAERSVKAFLPDSFEQRSPARVNRLQNELRLIRGKRGAAKKYQNLGDLLVQVCRERTTHAEWRRIVPETQRRHDAQILIDRRGARQAGSESAQTSSHAKLR